MHTHEGPRALPVHIHRDAWEPADGLADPVHQEGQFDAYREDDAVRKEGRAVDEHVLGELYEGDDMQGVVAVRVDQVRNHGHGGDC